MTPALVLALPGMGGDAERRAGSGLWATPAGRQLAAWLERSRARPLAPGEPPAALPAFSGYRQRGLARLAAAGDGLPLEGTALLRADPVYFRADRSRLLVFGPRVLNLDPAEAEALTARFTAFYADRGWRLQWVTPERWYLALPREPDIRTRPLPEVDGREVEGRLPGGTDARAWHALLNEIQMLFHDHPVNQARRDAGRPQANGIWPWGEGEPSALAWPGWSGLWSDDPLDRGMARHAGIDAAPLPEDFAAWRRAAGAGRHLLVLPDSRQAPDPAARLQDLLESWLVPAWVAPGTGSALYWGDGRLWYRKAGWRGLLTGLRRWRGP